MWNAISCVVYDEVMCASRLAGSPIIATLSWGLICGSPEDCAGVASELPPDTAGLAGLVDVVEPPPEQPARTTVNRIANVNTIEITLRFFKMIPPYRYIISVRVLQQG